MGDTDEVASSSRLRWLPVAVTPTVAFAPCLTSATRWRSGSTELGEFIRSQREVARISVRRLAELADVSNPYLSQIERGLRKPSADILQQIAKALQISSESLYVRAGILDPEHDVVVSVVEAVHRDPHLAPGAEADAPAGLREPPGPGRRPTARRRTPAGRERRRNAARAGRR